MRTMSHEKLPWMSLCARAGLISAALALLPSAGAVAMPAAVADFVPHKATYELFLDRKRRGDGVSSAGGRMEFEWADVCDGWSITQKTQIYVGRSEGYNLNFGWSLSTWEAKDGLAYRFFIRRYTDGQESELLRGEAHLETIGGEGRAVFSSPEEKEVGLPAGTVFPTWHSFELLDLAQSEERGLWSVLFDGAGDDDGLSAVSAFITGEAKPQREGLLDSALIQAQPSWRMILAYYTLDDQEALPIHEQELRLFVTGVAEDFVFDYGDFALRARLVELSELPPTGC
jgi:hypothetical protein